MLALVTLGSLAFVKPTSLKRNSTPSISTHPLDVSGSPTSLAWSTAGDSCLILSSGSSIHKVTSDGASVTQIHKTDAVVGQVLSRDLSLIYSSESSVAVFNLISSASSEVVTLSTHASPITALTLSHDASLLASCSASQVHIHNLAHPSSSHATLRSLPDGVPITASTFHPHVRTRLLVAAGRMLLVYDVLRPSVPAKVIQLGDDVVGKVCSIACSPFSKTLVVAATTGGTSYLVDLDKEKGLVRALNLKTPLTSVSFSPEGAALYFATNDGRLLIVDLRGLDKPPRSIIISEQGLQILGMALQDKSKAGTNAPVANLKATSSTAALAVAKASPTRRSSATGSGSPRSTRASSATSTATTSSAAATTSRSPARAAATRTRPGLPSPLSKPTTSRRTDVTNARTPGPVKSGRESDAARRVLSPLRNNQNSPGLTTGTAGVGAPVRKGSSAVSRQSTRSSAGAGAATLVVPGTRVSSNSTSPLSRRTGTPSPDLPAPSPVTPLPAKATINKRRGMSVLGLGTPRAMPKGLEGEIEAEEDKRTGKDERRVGFVDEEQERDAEENVDSHEGEDEHERVLSMQVSPRRPSAVPPSIPPLFPSSPFRSSSQSNGFTQDALRHLLTSALYDAQRESRAEVRGLHLDVLRLGRMIRAAVEEGVAPLREENRALREEISALRRELRLG